MPSIKASQLKEGVVRYATEETSELSQEEDDAQEDLHALVKSLLSKVSSLKGQLGQIQAGYSSSESTNEADG